MSDEEDVDHAVPSNVISRSTLVRSALVNADANSNGYVPSCWRVVDEIDGASDVIGFGSQWNSIEVFAEASTHVASTKDHQAARERAAEELSYTIIVVSLMTHAFLIMLCSMLGQPMCPRPTVPLKCCFRAAT